MPVGLNAPLMSAGKAAEEEPLFPTDEPGTPQDHPRAGRGLHRGERELRQRAQTQRGHHRPKVRLRSSGDDEMNADGSVGRVFKERGCFACLVRGKSACPNSTLTSLIERESFARAPPPIAHIKQHSSK